MGTHRLFYCCNCCTPKFWSRIYDGERFCSYAYHYREELRRVECLSKVGWMKNVIFERMNSYWDNKFAYEFFRSRNIAEQTGAERFEECLGCPCLRFDTAVVGIEKIHKVRIGGRNERERMPPRRFGSQRVFVEKRCVEP